MFCEFTIMSSECSIYILTGVSNSMFSVSHLPSPHCRVVETIPDANSVLGQIEVVLILLAIIYVPPSYTHSFLPAISLGNTCSTS